MKNNKETKYRRGYEGSKHKKAEHKWNHDEVIYLDKWHGYYITIKSDKMNQISKSKHLTWNRRLEQRNQESATFPKMKSISRQFHKSAFQNQNCRSQSCFCAI